MAMGISTGIVVAGKVCVEGLTLPEGATVTVVSHNPPDGLQLSPEDEQALLDAIAEAERGDTISAEQLFDRLDEHAKA